MANTGSFIPRQSNQPAPRKKITRRVYVLNYVVYVLFFGTLFITAALFVWEFQLNKSLDQQKSLLEAERNKFSQSDIEKVRELDRQLSLARSLLDNHTSVRQIFNALEDATLQNVDFSGFVITDAGVEEGVVGSVADSGANTYYLSLVGGLNDFNTLLFQREVLQQNSLLSGAEIRQVIYGLGEDGGDQIALSEAYQIAYEITIPVAMSDIPYRAPLVEGIEEEESGEGSLEEEASETSSTESTDTDTSAQETTSDITNDEDTQA